MRKISGDELLKNAVANPDVGVPSDALPKQDKTQAHKQLEAEQRKNFAMKFEAIWQQLGGPALQPEFPFCPARKWRADYRVGNLLIELDGGIYSGGRHTRGRGFAEDCVKLNTATLLGYQVIRIPTGFATANYLQQIIDYLKGQTA